MLYFLGNCQMDFLGRSVRGLGYDCTYRVLASPFTYNSSAGVIPPELAQQDALFGLSDFYHDRQLLNQFQLIGPAEEKPELIVMNLFHENSPLFIHNSGKYIFFINPEAWQGRPQFEDWMKSECGMIGANPLTYLKRYEEMLRNVRINFPETPLIVVSRLSHFPSFGPAPYSYLEGWDKLWRTAGPVLKKWQEEISGLHVLDMDRIFGGIWHGSERRIEAHCPFLKFELTEENDVITGLHASRDVEHIGSMWPVMAGKISQFMEEGRITYNESECVPEEWYRPWQPKMTDEKRLLEMLSSGANYLCAEAVGTFFLNLEQDYTPLLAETAEFTPVCHNTLHMIRTYGRIWRNPALSRWCQVHRSAAAEFNTNGPIYKQDYLERIDEIERYVLEN